MIEQSDLQNATKTPLESSNLTSSSTHENFRRIVEHMYLDSNHVQNLKALFSRCLQNQDKDLAAKSIEILDYLTSNYPQMICPHIDDEEFLQNVFEIAQKYQLEQALVLLHHWEPYIQKNFNYFLKKKCDLIIYIPGFKKVLSDNPRLKHLASENLKVLSVITSVNAILLSCLGSKPRYEDFLAKASIENTRILELLKDESLNDQDRKGLEDLKTRIKKKTAELTLDEDRNEKSANDKTKKKESEIKKDSQEKSKEAIKSQNDPLNEESKSNSVFSVESDAKFASNILTIEELRQYKLEKCKNLDCPYKPIKERNEKFKNKDLRCPYWHFDYDKRREVVVSNSSNSNGGVQLAYHAKMCDKKGCKFKEKCLFSHNFFESYYHPLYYKKFSCQENLNDNCDRNRYCPYVHQKEEEEHWTEYIKEKFGLDRNKPFKLPVENENEKMPSENEGDLEVKKEINSKKILEPKPFVPKKTKGGTGKYIDPPPGKILDPVVNSTDNLPLGNIVKDNAAESNSTKQNTEPKLKGFKGKESKKDSLRVNSQPFFDLAKGKDEPENKDEKKPEPLTTENQSNKANASETVLQKLTFKEEGKSSDEQEKKGKKKQKEPRKGNERDTVDESIINRAFFIENEELAIANKQKFHFITNKDEIRKPKVITKTICAMLNTEGGWIFIGIDEAGKVIGLSLKFEERDQFKQTLINALQRFSPKPGNNDYSINFIEIKSQSNEALPNSFVMKIQIKKADTKTFFCNEKEEYYHRSEEGKNERYSPKQVQDEIIRRKTTTTSAPVNQTNQIKDSINLASSGMTNNNPLVSNQSNITVPQASSQQQYSQQQHQQHFQSQPPLQQQPQNQQTNQIPPPNYLMPPYGMNFNSSQQFCFSGGTNQQMNPHFQHPPGFFVVFVPYNPYLPNPWSQLLNMAMMAPNMSSSSMSANFFDNKIDESKSETNYPTQPQPNTTSTQYTQGGSSYLSYFQQQQLNTGSGTKTNTIPTQPQGGLTSTSKPNQPNQTSNGLQGSQPNYKSQPQFPQYGFMHMPQQYGAYSMPFHQNNNPCNESDNSSGAQSFPSKYLNYPHSNHYYYNQPGINFNNQNLQNMASNQSQTQPMNSMQANQGAPWQMPPIQNTQYSTSNINSWPNYSSVNGQNITSGEKQSQEKDESTASDNKS